MSHTDLNEILEKFKKEFPPARNLNQSRLKLTTGDITEMLVSFHPGLQIPGEGIYSTMKELGYLYEPIEQNERIVFYWLIELS